MTTTRQKNHQETATNTTLDVSDPASLLHLFKKDNKALSERENHFLKQARYKVSKHASGVEWIDFTCKDAGYGVGDGNTICDGKFIRRGLQQLSQTLTVPKDKQIELIKFTKTNGDCCMFSYVPEHDLYLIATRNVSILVKDIKDS